MDEERKILFLMSVPRSGSTVVQDHLAAKLEGAITAPETWFIPFALAARSELSFSPIGLGAARLAEDQFGIRVFDKHIFVGIESFFSSMLDAVPGAKIFVEKTPRNVFYNKEISAFLPKALKVILVRHPIDIALSSFSYFCHGRPNLAKVSIDLHEGIDAVADIVRSGEAILVRYEDFIADNGKTLREGLCKAGLAICETNSLYEDTVLRQSRLGDTNFKATKSVNGANSYKYGTTKISFIMYLVLSGLLKRESYRYVLETLYDLPPEDLSRVLRKNVNRFGTMDLLALIGGSLSAIVNLKIIAFKFKKSSLWAYLR